MKIVGILIVLALGLFLTYYIAGDYMTASQGGSSEEMKFEPMKITKEVTEKLGGAQDEMKEKIDEAIGKEKEKKEEDR
ncbi:hypothetical protein EPN96_10820 [bacterium]|nr:MAG: hypothetical protein EPN96_10820 [bacterium]